MSDSNREGPTVTGSKFIKNGTGILAPSNSRLKIDECEFKENIEAIHLYENEPKTPQLKPLVAAIKKPSANDNKGWKIMFVGSLFSLLIGVILVHYSEWLEERNQPSHPEQKTVQQKDKIQ